MDMDALVNDLGQRSISDHTLVPEDPPAPEPYLGVLGLSAPPSPVIGEDIDGV